MILVAGSTGLVGGQICLNLAKAGKPVRALVRSTSDRAKVDALKRTGVELAEGDLKDRSTLDAACAGVLTVISTASSTLSHQAGDTIETVVSAPRPHYTVINLGTLGGSQSNGYGGVTNNGWVSGDSFLPAHGTEPADATEHAFVWRDGVMTDLGTVGGLNSGVAYPTKDDRGLVVGQSQGSQIDPLKEYWGVASVCIINGFPTPCDGWQNLVFGFLWQDRMTTVTTTKCAAGASNGRAGSVSTSSSTRGRAALGRFDSLLQPEAR